MKGQLDDFSLTHPAEIDKKLRRGTLQGRYAERTAEGQRPTACVSSKPKDSSTQSVLC
jgi:hypothetical protein